LLSDANEAGAWSAELGGKVVSICLRIRAFMCI
jgi:hypothetical protein